MCLLWLLSRNVVFNRKEIKIGKKRMDALVADTPRKMTAGLMFRKSMKQNECMLFTFPEDGTHPIWMRNMRFPLDIVWLDSNRRVVDFVESAKPSSGLDFSGYRSKTPSRYVIELNAGFVRKNKIKIKDVAKFGV
ncbi:MAG: DUF192 domain-containing protein [Candidatus Marsarchaeota archaeon]|jgi:uncharacterized membrane protein (UPF0127 family)|nr:DUF192 domain-containing protein [Candidatus Marsarchaeota archaeon]MCL5111661.1 DUF192 domain-containing protein [Candidatus Marsarchaeota archaeon]